MSRLIDAFHQVRGVLAARNGGTANAHGWGSALVEPHVNWSTSDPLALGTIVELHNGSQVRAVTVADSVDVLGVVVGYQATGSGLLVEADCPAGGIAAVMTKGRCLARIAADVAVGDHAYAHATDGYGYGSAMLAAGAFGRWLGSGRVAVTDLCPVELAGSVVTSAGSGVTYGTPALAYGTAAAVGSLDEAIRRDATLALFAAGIPTAQAFGDAGAAGTSGAASRHDHRHGMPSLGAVTAQTAYGAAASNGSAGSASRSDHVHGTVDGKAELEVHFVTPTAGDRSRPIRVPWPCTITGWYLAADAAGSCVLDIWKDTFAAFPPTVADSITAADKPTLAAARTASGTSLTGWTTALAAGDWLIVKVDSASTITDVVLALTVTKA